MTTEEFAVQEELPPPRRDRGVFPRLAVVAVAVAVLVGVAVGAWAISRNFATSKEANDFAVQIQRERYNACVASNARNRSTIRTLDRLIADRLKTHPELKVQLQVSREGTVALINSLAPRRNCKVAVPQD